MSRVQDSFELVGTVLDAKFHVERAIAEGGFAIVYAGSHMILNRPVAIKVLKRQPGFDEQEFETFIESFASEARAIVKINHPHIVQVLDFGVSRMPNGERAPWMVMEWLEGKTLREDLVERRGQGGRTPGDAYLELRPILEALAYAHDEGIAHRDVKPSNIMMVPTRRGTVMKLVDFGIAKVMKEEEKNAELADTHTNAQFQAFSLNYATPEQVGHMRTGPWTDVHAIALVLTEVILGKPVLAGGSRAEILGRVVGMPRPTPAFFGCDVGAALESVLARAMALRPAERYPNAGELLAALDGAIAPVEYSGSISGVVQFGRITGTFPLAPAAVTGELPAASQPQPVAASQPISSPRVSIVGTAAASGALPAVAAPDNTGGNTNGNTNPTRGVATLASDRSLWIFVVLALALALVVGAGIGFALRATATSSNEPTPSATGSGAASVAAHDRGISAVDPVAPSNTPSARDTSAAPPSVASARETPSMAPRPLPPPGVTARPRPVGVRPRPILRPRAGGDPDVE